MKSRVTGEQLEAWRTVCDDATPGPWSDTAGHISFNEGEFYLADLTCGLVGNPGRNADQVDSDVTFIVLARTAMPLLISEATALREERDKLVDLLESVVVLAEETRIFWDSDQGMRVGKILCALAGHVPNCRADIRAIHDALAAAKKVRPS